MRSVVVHVANGSEGWRGASREVEAEFGARWTEPNRLVVDLAESWAALTVDTSVLQHYDDDEIDRIVQQAGAGTVPVVVEFHDLEALERVVRSITRTTRSAVDDDHGSIVSGEEFLERLDELRRNRGPADR